MSTNPVSTRFDLRQQAPVEGEAVSNADLGLTKNCQHLPTARRSNHVRRVEVPFVPGAFVLTDVLSRCGR